MFASKSIDSDMLLRWSKHLEYDFFRLYSHHLILYAPVATLSHTSNTQNKNSALPVFRKNLYTQEIIDFILEMINSGEMTRQQVIDEYRIPKTTLYKWISKYRNS
ncbi:helix-turn-helix domain-containing protein [uncultured Chryseobacterium sp.]|uniref:helix-turn-helix domain-containing protein n=1 Tax=uncultured Chryseobacterium sp. TaxID=259322 RepID=UPI0027DBC8AB|nr:helix-turn-helix domain-containing protein [uncultured Chryseobacterium sp.]